MEQRFHVQARWDPEANVWIPSSNIPGLVVEALAPEMLADNLGIKGPVPVDVHANRTLDLMVA